jgi:DNA-directed RNA polymerase omega subunit
MTDEHVVEVPEEVPDTPDTPETPEPPQPTAAPIRSRFLFVDVAAQRAKQLRRGARPRVDRPEVAHKLERVAMREVKGGFVEWTLPPFKGAPSDTVS